MTYPSVDSNSEQLISELHPEEVNETQMHIRCLSSVPLDLEKLLLEIEQEEQALRSEAE